MGIGIFEILGAVCLLFLVAVVAGVIVISMKKPHDQ
jgi:hypothetical protein